MGTWGTGLYSNDTTSDVKDIYIDLLKRQKDNETAYAETKEMLADVFGTEEEPLFWYALADTQWNIGRLMPEVKEKALMFINNKGGRDIWEGNLKNISKWENNLKNLEEKLNTPQPPEKTFPKAKDFVSNPWNIGDVYAYNGIPIGIVFSNTISKETKIVALSDIDSSGAPESASINWSTSYSGNYSYTTGATSAEYESTAKNDMNGKYNTEKILSYIASNDNTAMATTATSLYAPRVCEIGAFCAKSNWYLPAAGELWILYSNKAIINNAIANVGGTILDYYYWSSTEHSASQAWRVSFTLLTLP